MNDKPTVTHSFENEDTVARLLQIAGHRPAAPEWDAAIVKRAARAAWRKKVKSRSRRTLYWRAGGLLAAAVLTAVVGLRFWAPLGPLEPIATVETTSGSVTAFLTEEPDERAAALGVASAVLPGTVVETAAGGAAPSRAALRLAGGQSLRLDAGTRLRLESSTVLALDRGAVYVDSGPAGAAGSVEVRTVRGVARDIGTQFEVRFRPDEALESTLRLRVREGTVDLTVGGEAYRAEAGVELAVQPDGEVARGAVPRYGAVWDWVRRIAPAFDAQGRPLRDFLDWAAREGGWELSFADSDVESRARVATVYAPMEGLTLEEALDALLLSSNLSYRLEEGTLHVEAR